MKKLSRTQKLVQASMLAAITIILAMITIRINPVLEITLTVVPVALGGLVVGWPVGLALGTVFGLVSFFKAFTDAVGMLMISQSVVLAAMGCILPRVAVGLLADLFGRLARRYAGLRRVWFYAVSGFLCSLCNTVLFLGFIWLVFDSAVTGITFAVILTVVASNGIIEMIVNAALVGLLAKVLTISPGGKGAAQPPAPAQKPKQEDVQK